MVTEFWIGNHIVKVQNNFFSNIIKKKYGSSFVLNDIKDELLFFEIHMSGVVYDPNTFVPMYYLVYNEINLGYVRRESEEILNDIDKLFETKKHELRNNIGIKKIIAKFRLSQI